MSSSKLPRVIFMGSPDFSVPTLQALINSNAFNIVAVYSQPPRAKNRGHKLTKTPIHALAEENNIPAYTPLNFEGTDSVETFKNHNSDIAVVIAYGLIVPQIILDTPKHGCINLHASILPRWRGASPIQQAILHGDAETGVSLMQMDRKMDNGPVFTTTKIPITRQTTQTSLFKNLSNLSADILINNLSGILSDKLKAITQPVENITMAPKISKEDARINWQNSALKIDQKIRALTPWPGTSFVDDNEADLKLIAAEPIVFKHNHKPGTWLTSHEHELMITCSDGAMAVKMIQKSGSKALSPDVFLRGYQHKLVKI